MPNAWLHLILESLSEPDPVLSKRPPQKRPDNGRSAAFFMATYDSNPISIIN